MRKNLTMTLAVLALSTAIAVSGKPAMAETSLPSVARGRPTLPRPTPAPPAA